MSFNSTIIILKNYLEDLESELKKIEEKNVKSSGAKARLLLQKIKLECNLLRKDVLTKVKSIPTKSRKKVEISEVEEVITTPLEAPEQETVESSDTSPKVKKPRGRPKKVSA